MNHGFSVKLYSGAISQTDPFLTDTPLHDKAPALIFLPNLHVFIFAETQQTSTTKEPWRSSPPRGLNLILTKSNCAGRDIIFPRFVSFFSAARWERGNKGKRRDKGGGTREESSREDTAKEDEMGRETENTERKKMEQKREA